MGDVPEPEEKHNMDEYSDAKTFAFVLVQLLLEHAEEIVSDIAGPHDVLEELGEVPDMVALVGKVVSLQCFIKQLRIRRRFS